MRFKYFLDKRAPATGSVSSLDYDCEFRGAIEDDRYQFTLGVTVPIMTLCPCSKEISTEGSHSQRAELTVRLSDWRGPFVWIEDLVPLVEAQGSSGVFPILKRADEKAVTESAYDRPKFVEDVVRDTILALRELAAADWYSAECVSFESIHNHNAYAYAAESRESPDPDLA
jgi:GTP cyclohydrolase I